MISEVDLRDWERLDIQAAREVVNDLDDYAKMGVALNPVGAIRFMDRFFQQLEELKEKQLRKIPKLERK